MPLTIPRLFPDKCKISLTELTISPISPENRLNPPLKAIPYTPLFMLTASHM